MHRNCRYQILGEKKNQNEIQEGYAGTLKLRMTVPTENTYGKMATYQDLRRFNGG